MDEINVDVLVVGGGCCGLVASSMLSNLRVEHTLIERHTSTSDLPKASLLNQRTGEILDQHQLYAPIKAHGCPTHLMKHYHYVTSFGGDNPYDNFVLDKISCYGCNDDDPASDSDFMRYRAASAYTHTNLPQIRLEPILYDEALQRNPAGVKFGHDLVSIQEHEECVIAHARGPTGEVHKYRAKFLIAADGGKTVGRMLDIPFQGVRNLANSTSVHFKADLSLHWEDGTLLTWFVNPLGAGESVGTEESLLCAEWSVIVMSGPTWGKKSEEWVFHLGLGQRGLPIEQLTEDVLERIIKRTLKLPKLDIEILHFNRWQIDGVYATRYQTQRTFLAGDSAHRHPPFAGLGLNTAIGDVHNLTWKLAAVLNGTIGPKLLRTYHRERFSVGKKVALWALSGFKNLRIIDSAIGLLPGGSATYAQNEKILEELVESSFQGEARRASVRLALYTQRVETTAHDVEIGHVYDKGAFVPDGTAPPSADPRGFLYVPMARPGHRMPHLWLQKGSERFSTHHLLDAKGSWYLFTDDSRHYTEWQAEIEQLVVNKGLRVQVVRVGNGDEFRDIDGSWSSLVGIKTDCGGAVLVRPDGYVAFRSKAFHEGSVLELHQFFDDLCQASDINSSVGRC